MKATLTTQSEEHLLKILRKFAVLDTPPEQAFDDLKAFLHWAMLSNYLNRGLTFARFNRLIITIEGLSDETRLAPL